MVGLTGSHRNGLRVLARKYDLLIAGEVFNLHIGCACDQKMKYSWLLIYSTIIFFSFVLMVS
jgi:hypothetical protein